MTTDTDSIYVKTPSCRVCGHSDFVAVRESDLERYNAGALAQEAFPEMPIERREQLISGTHPECWKKLFA